MAYYTDLFSPETYEVFTQSDQSISGFRVRQKNAASQIKPGDKLVCYVTKISRWIGVLKVTSEFFEDSTPLFYLEDFEVEHSTAIYSGILRMADLLALQPNMDIRLHIVAPYSRKEKVLQEIQRPVFSLLDRAPLSEICSFISYDSVRELSDEQHLSYLSDAVLEEYSEEA